MNKLSSRHLWWLLLIYLFSGSLFGQAISTSAIYRNEDIGVRAAFLPTWQIVTSREQAPDVLKPNFPANKGPNDSPLFIGIHDSGQLYIRLLTETYFDDLEAYGSVMAAGVVSQGLEVLSVKLAQDESALEMSYRHPQLGLRFLERVALLADSQVIRMAIWTSDNGWNDFSRDIASAFSKIELLDAVKAQSGWQPLWADLEQRLPGENLPGISIASSRPSPGTPRQCPDPSSSMLWQVDSEALQSRGVELYLFGAIHVGKPDFYPLPDEIEETFLGADYLVFEVDPTTAEQPEVIRTMQAKSMLPQGQSLEDVVSAQVITDFRRLLGNIGLPAENFMGMQPWFVTLMLTGLQMNAMGYLPQYGLESYFLSRKPAATTILELESIQQQIGFLQALNAESYLAYTIKSFESGSEEVENLIAAWKCADKGPLADMLFADFDDDTLSAQEKADMDYLMEALYTRRNVDMAAGISGFADARPGRYFVVIGSAHLLGEQSVITHLRNEGFSVSPVSISP